MIAQEETRRGASSYDHPFQPSASPRATLRFAQDRLEFGDGTILARLARTRGGWTNLFFIGGEACALARLTAACLRPVPPHAFDALRRAASKWVSGDKALAQIMVAQTGLTKFEPADLVAHHLSLADSLRDSGFAPEQLVKALDLEWAPVAKAGYNPEEPRVPKGNPNGGDWTRLFDEAASAIHVVSRVGEALVRAGADAAAAARVAARIMEAAQSKLTVIRAVPHDTSEVRAKDDSLVRDLSSPKGTLLAPSSADFGKLYAEGQSIADEPTPEKWGVLLDDFGYGGQYDFQRDLANNIFYSQYTNASNYGIGIFANGAGFNEDEIVSIHRLFAKWFSSNAASTTPLHWLKRGWEDAHDRKWLKK